MKWSIIIILLLVLGAGLFYGVLHFLPWATPIDSYKGVAVYPNGNNFVKSHGRYYSFSGYYYGQKWQCVEFIKRFYFQAKGHSMPNVWGHAADFFDPEVPQGQLNSERNLVQFRNGGDTPPQADDLIVFQNLTSYGHVAIVTEVSSDTVFMIQQNVGKNTRYQLPIYWDQGVYWVGNEQLQATGWLRKRDL